MRRLEFFRTAIADALPEYDQGGSDMITVRYTPKLADLMPGAVHPDASLGPAAWSAYLRFDHSHPAVSNVHLRRALAHAIDRDALAAAAPANLVVATGGVVPPALQGHTPDIALRYDPDLARAELARPASTASSSWPGCWSGRSSSASSPPGGRTSSARGSVRHWSWQREEAMEVGGRADKAYLRVTGWFPGYADPEYFLRLLFHSDSRTNEGGFSNAAFDDLIERARRERNGRTRLELFHEADRVAVVEQVACIPLVYGRNVAYVKPWVHGWWEFGKTSSSFADLVVNR